MNDEGVFKVCDQVWKLLIKSEGISEPGVESILDFISNGVKVESLRLSLDVYDVLLT